MQKNYKESHLELYAIKSINSKGRIYNEPENLIRTPYQRDRDRIIHSSSFRRLKHKTQVFVNTDGDHYRTRITHSMEVSQIARTLARHLRLNEDLCETLSLAHDLGHTPFGHAGEEALRDCMEKFTEDKVVEAVQFSQDAQAGYACDYCAKRQPMAFNEVKECCKGHSDLSERLAGEGVNYIGKRHATRLMSDAYGSGIVRGPAEHTHIRA